MAPKSTEAIVLKTVPFKESSLILHLFTKEHGLVHAVAKGVKSSKKGTNFIERGFLIEIVLYNKPDRDLDTAGLINIVKYYDNTRKNIVKTALRDTAFETVLSVIHHRDEHSELFTFFVKFLESLNSNSENQCYPKLLWLFYYRFIENLGFAFNLHICSKCNSEISGKPFLNIPKGGLECDICKDPENNSFISNKAIAYIKGEIPNICEFTKELSKKEIETTNRSLLDYIRYHFEIRKDLKTLDFLQNIIF